MFAFTFPGQGSQRPGMGAAWKGHPSWERVTEVSEATGRDVSLLLLEAGPDELRETQASQLATFALSLVILDAAVATGAPTPAACAGHSLGEYTALVAAEILSTDDATRVVLARADAMQAAADARPGTMAAVIGLDGDAVALACQQAGGEAWVANFNAPGQVVVAGSPEGVRSAGKQAKQLGAKKVLPIPVGGAFHTGFMAPAQPALAAALEEADIVGGRFPVVANVDAQAHEDPAEWPALLVAQLCQPVRWRQSVERLAGAGVTTLVELGPGDVLSRMARRIAPKVDAMSVASPADLEHLAGALEHDGSVAEHPEGEHLSMMERLVVSPASGVFQRAERWRNGSAPESVDVGDVLGTVGTTEVRSRFAGVVMGLIALDGERVSASQPIAWLRTA